MNWALNAAIYIAFVALLATFVYRDMRGRGQRPWPWVVGVVLLGPLGLVLWLAGELRHRRVHRSGGGS
jgi:uncharacterized membrane protein (UPF0136 family)